MKKKSSMKTSSVKKVKLAVKPLGKFANMVKPVASDDLKPSNTAKMFNSRLKGGLLGN